MSRIPADMGVLQKSYGCEEVLSGLLASLGPWERGGAMIGAERSGPASTLNQQDAHGS